MAVSRDQYSQTRPSKSPYARFGYAPRPGMSQSPMSRSYLSGRSYIDPDRMAEREARMEDRFARRKMANFELGGSGGGGGSRGSGGGGGLPELPPMPGYGGTPRVSQTELADLAASQFGNAPSMGTDYANAAARMQGGWGTLGDVNLLEQRSNPSAPSNVSAANARLRMRGIMRDGYKPPRSGSLVQAAKDALLDPTYTRVTQPSSRRFA